MKHFLWAALALPLALAACDLEGDPEQKLNQGSPEQGGVDANGVDWTNYQTAGTRSIYVRNNANVDLVAFMNKLSEQNKLGGVPKGGGVHGLKMNEDLFNATKDFSIIFLTPEKYAQNKSNLVSQEQTPFTRIYALYNKSGTNDIPFEVSDKLGGNNRFRIHNTTSFDAEFRENSPRGIALGYAPNLSNNTILYMNDADFFIYPVFKKYNKITDEIITIYPKKSDGRPLGIQMEFHGGLESTISADTYLTNVNGYSMGAALLVVKNSCGNGMSIQKGVTTLRTETGIETINHGDGRTFTIRMNGDQNSGYDAEYDFSGWDVYVMGTKELSLNIGEFFNDNAPEKNNKLVSDYRYTITINGTLGENLIISSVVKSLNKITADFFN